MAARRLGPDEEALWARVRATVRAMPGRKVAAPSPERLPLPAPMKGMTAPSLPTPPPSHARREPGHTLDGGWDRRLAGGVVAPDRTIDLHGHTLASAHAALEMGLGQAVSRGDRVILLVTGKPPRPESQRPHARGAIRAAIPDWLRLSAYAGAIAAVRGAHPRHGGAGALYVVLRRRR
ncbi:MAG: Smr/MutS family protein [Sphingomonas phyllosphaerae]|uniref:Smr/MutS family protein n=1 Tax=Sphingomonas phyllosphaerae TaxID=257003 RepID=UPI002FF49450